MATKKSKAKKKSPDAIALQQVFRPDVRLILGQKITKLEVR